MEVSNIFMGKIRIIGKEAAEVVGITDVSGCKPSFFFNMDSQSNKRFRRHCILMKRFM